jgi:phenylpyruvate tautomerase PptA (4-oxalocrotonate tautomerase family)
MPLVKLQVSAEITESGKAALLEKASRALAEVTGKPEAYVMAVIEKGDFLMAGKPGPAALVDIRGIGGLTKPVNAKLAEAFCALLKKELGIAPDRVYLNFADIAAQNWGWKGTTFG